MKKDKTLQVTKTLTPALLKKLQSNSYSNKDLAIPDDYVIQSVNVIDTKQTSKSGRVTIKQQATIKAVLSNEITPERMLKAVKGVTPLKRIAKAHKTTSNKMALINMYDFHLGRLAHDEEVYGVSYDTKIACKVFADSIDTALERLKDKKLEKIVLNFGGDFFNADNLDNTTTSRAHGQDVDTRYSDYYKKGTQLMAYAVRESLKIANQVLVPCVPGNHDRQSFILAMFHLEALFSNNPNVIIDTTPSARSIVTHGTNLIVLTHGIEGKRRKNLPLIEPAAKKELSKATNVEIISGHTHTHELTTTEDGFTVETCGQMAPVADAWTANSGYNEAQGEMYVFIYDEKYRDSQFTIHTKEFLPKNKTRKLERWELDLVK